MPPEEFRLLAERLRGRAAYLYLHVMGEPLLHPQLREILDVASELGFRVCVTTNGTLLPEKGETLLSAASLGYGILAARRSGTRKYCLSLQSGPASGRWRCLSPGGAAGVWESGCIWSRRKSLTGPT